MGSCPPLSGVGSNPQLYFDLQQNAEDFLVILVESQVQTHPPHTHTLLTNFFFKCTFISLSNEMTVM